MAPAAPKTTLFDDSESEGDHGGAQLEVNEEYAARFKHNKERAERHRLEEKYKGQSLGAADDEEDDEDSSDDETEDDDAELATEELDAQLAETLRAIRNKDPRIYDPNSTFYTPIGETEAETVARVKKEKPITLKDYHRENILRGDTGADVDEDAPKTYVQEQADMQKSIRDEIKAQFQADAGEAESDEDDGFIKPKEGALAKAKAEVNEDGVHPSRAAKVKPMKISVADADKDPELYLSNFMASRAWIGGDKKWEAFESDEGEDDGKADEWEAAYNLRFEDPNKSNEVLKTYARDVAAAKSVRREEPTGRKKQRELERERKEAEKQQRKEEKARLRRMKVEEAEKKLKQIKKAAGLSGKVLKEEDWAKFLEEDWSDGQWEQEMQKTFGDQYYAEGEAGSGDDDAGAGGKKKVKKPKWKDDIDIKDIIPDFADEEKPDIALSDLEGDAEQDEDGDEDDEGAPSTKRRKTTKDRKKERLASQREARKERSKLEALVDAKMELEDPDALAAARAKRPGGLPAFGYRETWDESFGLTPRDILMAPDTALNEYAGLKKLAHFRPDDKKSKDRKRLGKKARLRQWRRDTFGREAEHDGPAFALGAAEAEAEEKGKGKGKKKEGKKEKEGEEANNVVEGGSKKRKRPGRKGKMAAAAAAAAAS